MSAFADYFVAHEELFAHYKGLAVRLTDEQMAVRSLCPDWDVRGVLTHVIGAEHWINGWEPSDSEFPSFDRMTDFEARARDLNRPDFALLIAETTASRLDDLNALGTQSLQRPSLTPAGPANYERFLQIRIFDMWVHARDIAIPLGQHLVGENLNDSGFAAQKALQEVDESIGYIVGKKIGLPDQMSIAFRIRGALEHHILVRVDGRAKRVFDLAVPDVEVVTDIVTFVMLAAGRIDPQAQIDTNKISWSGDSHWGETAVRNLAYTR